MPDPAAALDQPYTRLARGGNVHVYAAADGAYVLKTLATVGDILEWFASDGVVLTELPWARALTPRPAPTEADIAAAIQARSLASYRLAARYLRAETALVHLQLPGETGRFPRVTLPGGDFDAATEPFILQHRATLVRHSLTDPAAGRAVIDAVIALVAHLWSRGIAEDTLNFHNNMGFVAGKLVQVDIGELSRSRAAIRDHARTAKLLRKKSFAWLAGQHPDLAAYMRDQVTQHLSLPRVEARWPAPT